MTFDEDKSKEVLKGNIANPWKVLQMTGLKDRTFIRPMVFIDRDNLNFFYIFGGCEQVESKRHQKPKSIMYKLEIDTVIDFKNEM